MRSVTFLLLLLIVITTNSAIVACGDFKLPNSMELDVGKAMFSWQIETEFIVMEISIASQEQLTYVGMGFGNGMTNTVRGMTTL